jgi:hypothetical protein
MADTKNDKFETARDEAAEAPESKKSVMRKFINLFCKPPAPTGGKE